jgi:F0F1-type ATP synthase gamma subunit
VVFSRNAMDNAQKNASDMISSLQMKYNRGRQAAITNELVDIITGSFRMITYKVSCLKILYPGASAL